MAKAKKLPSGNWRARVYVGTINGKRTYKSFTHAEKDMAEFLAQEYKTKKKRDSSTGNISIDEAVTRYIKAKYNVLSPATIRGYKIMQRVRLDDIRHLTIEDITKEQLQMWVSNLSVEYSPKTVRNTYGLVTAAIHFFNPAFSHEVTLPQKKKTSFLIPSDEAIRKLLSEVAGTDLEVPVLLGAIEGLRRSEICALTYDDVDFDNNTIYINKAVVSDEYNKYVPKDTPKEDSSNRLIKIHPQIIEKIIERKKQNLPLCGLRPPVISDRFVALAKRLNLTGFTFHKLRHYSASIMHALGIPDKYAMKRMGHSTNHMLQTVYQHIISEEEEKLVEKIHDHISF